MNELATVACHPTHTFSTAPFASARQYFQNLADEHLTHLWTQRNLADDPEDARRRYLARHQFKQLIPRYCIDDAGPFKPFCDDMQPSNMLIDEDTLEITAVLDIEFTNITPAQFAYDPPWWLLLLGPDMWLEHRSMEDFLALYRPRLDQFLRALEKVETELEYEGDQPGKPYLSARMRDSWDTGRFWFNYAARKSFDVDAIYWAALHKGGWRVDVLDDKVQADIERFIQTKMEQQKAYKEGCAVLFGR